ncbi:MAG: hypothetical protein HZA72_01695 [Candidatus Omnitrophica bacterium]|nr:hypothetical protein [Candidatus Omnitrophota bacterium]
MKNFFVKDKVLISAILFSALWHIFWLSAFVVVVVPKSAKVVKFSNISFLGPILDRGILSVSLKPQEQTAPERRYLADIEKYPTQIGERCGTDDYVREGVYEALPPLVMIDTQKIEPGRDID